MSQASYRGDLKPSSQGSVLWMLNKTTNDPDLREKLADISAQQSPGRDILAGIVPDPASQEAGETLQREGYVLCQPALTQDMLDEIRSYFAAVTDTVSDATLTYYKIQDVILAPYLLKLACHPDILKVVANYLKVAPTILDLSAWRTDPTDVVTVGAQVPHRDTDDFRFCKLFVYLSDVDSYGGPHVYLPRSHSKVGMEELCERHGLEAGSLEQAFDNHSRAQSGWIAQNFSRDMLEFTGPAGTMFLENTFGFHFGKLPERSSRFMFQALYGQMAYDYRAKRLKQTHACSISDLMLNDPLSRYACRLLGRS